LIDIVDYTQNILMHNKPECNMQLREALKDKLTEKEMSELKTAFDVVGDIAILEIDDSLKKKEKIIAETLLLLHKNIKTVLKKAAEHSGEFRTQKMKYLAGVKTKESIHKELNTQIKLDVEKVYFSPRLSTERKRIMEQVKDGENILVMFSGCAPYPCVIAKNKKPARIVGIEINPVGHKYGLENVKLNKLKNVELYCGDVRSVVPKLTKKRLIGLKANWRPEHLKAKLKENPELLEIYIGSGDLENNLEDIKEAIKKLKEKGIKIMLHTPFVYKAMEVNICTAKKKIEENAKECYAILEMLCREFGLIGFVAHVYTYREKDAEEKFGIAYKNTKKTLYRFLTNNHFPHMHIENMPWGIFSEPNEVIKTVKKFRLKMCCDIAHAYLVAEKEEDFYSAIKEYSKIEPYFHIADSRYLGAREDLKADHSLPIGAGKIDFSRVLPYVKIGIAEVVSKNELNPVEMIDSYKKLKAMAKKLSSFDRVLMPLPKSAEDFLQVALSAAKTGTIIHFYDFLHESEFSKAEEKVKNACEIAGLNYKKRGFARCGQHSPRTYRVCFDFEVY
jgi:tRNA (guanine37-N1)-methyltransferase